MPTEPSRHRIRLRGPWIRCPGETVRYRRQFNCPTGLSPDTQLSLTFQDCDRLESVKLNDTMLQLESVDDRLLSAKVDHLRPGANHLEVQLFAADGDEPSLAGEIALQIVERR